ncbi:Thiosulfate sulfurtransferase 18 (Sulfurtransferase 18) (AtStr18) [Durusdinium trenchii]|uniref:Thiosulfate sulfurtransferase 18 (Sulfurtransferase 18) (AtStr18) n=1 Tax=Durusdinium trenchii TaxID=1381693 RepID=A0ABP0IWY5_9DINO
MWCRSWRSAGLAMGLVARLALQENGGNLTTFGSVSKVGVYRPLQAFTVRRFKSIASAEAMDLLKSGWKYLDVRRAEEGEAYGVPCVPSGSSYHLVTSHVLGPRGMVFDSEAWLEDVQQKIPDKEAKIVIGCAAGVRSKAAARVLEAAGYLNVQELDDGFNGWAARNRSCRSGLHDTKPLTEDLKLLDAEPFHF